MQPDSEDLIDRRVVQVAREPTRETLGFQAEVKQLLKLMIHSLYSNKEIFLRELISNASDASDKLRFEALTDKALYESDADLKIRVSFDKEARTVTVSDNGIGMSRQEVIELLTARSHRIEGELTEGAAVLREVDGGFFQVGTGLPYNPASGRFGDFDYAVTAASGTRYVYTRAAGLREIWGTNGQRIVWTDSGRELTFTRRFEAPAADVWASLTESERTELNVARSVRKRSPAAVLIRSR